MGTFFPILLRIMTIIVIGRIRVNPCNAESTFCPRYNILNIFDNYLNHVMLVFIGKPSLSTIIGVPSCQGFSHFSGFLHLSVQAILVTSSVRVKIIHLNILIQKSDLRYDRN